MSKQPVCVVAKWVRQFNQISWWCPSIKASLHKAYFTSVPGPSSMSSACHMCPPSSSMPFTFLSLGSPCNLILAATHNTLHGTQSQWYHTPLFHSLHLSPMFFVRLTSVCMSYPKLSLQLKWKSSLYPSDLSAITSFSLRHSCHVCCSLENLTIVLPFSPRLLP